MWLIEYQGKGLEKADNLKIDARIGTWCHNGIEGGLGNLAPAMIGTAASNALLAGGCFVDECKEIIDWSQATDQMKHDIAEGGHIVTALVYAWLRHKAPRLLGDGDILAIEKELTVDFSVPTIGGSETVRLMARPDIIWRRHQDGGIFIRNLKTVRNADDRWREKWALDMQTLSEPLAVDQWIRNQHYDKCSGCSTTFEQCGGVIIDGLVTGKITSAKSQFNGLYHHNNHLVYAFRQELPNGTYMHIPAYKYGLQKVSVADSYPGGIVAWVDYLLENHPEIVEEHIIELPPIIRSEYQIERWKRQVLPREVAIKRHAAMVDAAEGQSKDELMDELFPMHTAEGNCLYPGKCSCYNICFGSISNDPLGAGYVYRTPNHPQESDTISKDTSSVPIQEFK